MDNPGHGGPSPQMQTFVPADDSRGFRDALGAFATGVTIVTAAGPQGPAGITANSFASVSLDPPLVLWSPAKASSRFGVFSAAARFSIHVLAEEQWRVAQGFTRAIDAFDGLDWSRDAEGVPLIAGCLARFDCTREAVHDAGDHVIVVGRVLHAAHRPGGALLFQGGRFGRFGPDLHD